MFLRIRSLCLIISLLVVAPVVESKTPFDELYPWDECLNGPDEYGPCDLSKFPVCENDEQICYNRRPRQDKFYSDNRQPFFFIDYRNVFCYPDYWGGCSSCTPGRLCVSENRCILQEQDYPCETWI
ncbi:hypothetical protein ACA910_000710 [Epithemia clementina (nom. ined.)]